MDFKLQVSRYGLDWTEIYAHDNYLPVLKKLYDTWYQIPWLRIYRPDIAKIICIFHDRKSVGRWLEETEWYI